MSDSTILWNDPPLAAPGGVPGAMGVPAAAPVVPVLPGGEVDYLGMAADQIAKAATYAPRGAKPPYVHHRVGDALRVYANLNGVQEDLTPHYDANVKRTLASRNPPLRAVLNTLICNVVSHFGKPQTEKGVGMKVVQVDRLAPVTRASEKRRQQIEDIVYNGGMIRTRARDGEPQPWDSHEQDHGDPLPITIRKLMQDSLVLDQCFICTEGTASLNGGGNPIMFWRAEDGALMRFVDPDRYDPQVRNGWNGADDITGKVKYVQIAVDTTWRIEREYLWNEGRMGVRNVRTDQLAFGYGESEIEQCMAALIGALYALGANQDYFDKNKLPRGILNVIGNYDRTDIQNLRLQLAQQIGYGGGGGLFDFPIISSPEGKAAGAAWIPLEDRTRFDLIGTTYITLCVALISAIFQVAPEEYGFSAFGGATQVLQDADPESVIQNSKQRSVLPHVLWLCGLINRAVVWRIDPAYELVVQGLDSLYTGEATARAQLDLELRQQGYTLNMLRARADDPPVVDPKDWPLWRQIEDKMRGQWFPNDTVRTFEMIKAYEDAGGERSPWPDAPTLDAGAMQIWMHDHGYMEQQQTRQDMSQIAGGEAQGQQAEEAADTAGVRDQMTGMTQAADERDAAEGQRDDAAAAKDELRVPARQDARFGKAVPVAGAAPPAEGPIVVRIGRRPAPGQAG